MKEKEIFIPIVSILSLTAISFFAFSKELKEQVRKEQEGMCGMCKRKVKKLQIHHIIPQSLGGSDKRENAIGLCSECHRIADEMAFNGKFLKSS